MTLSFTTHWRDELPDFYTSLSPTPLDNARLIWRNAPLAQQLGVPDALFAPENGAGVWGGEALLPGMSPLAQVYSGHQFGAWAGQLGDGRGILLGEQQLADGRRYDWHLKGAGLTPIRGWETAAPCCARRSGKVWRQRRCTPWASRRRAPWRW